MSLFYWIIAFITLFGNNGLLTWADKCADPKKPANGYYYFWTDTLTSVVYVCHPGYSRLGPSTVKCTEEGWSPPPPICITSGCPKLEKEENGITRYSHGDAMVEIVCNKDYKLTGTSNIIVCDGNTWNGTQPVCEATEKAKETTESKKSSAESKVKVITYFPTPEDYKKEHDDWLKEADYSCITAYGSIAPPSVLNGQPSTKWVFVDDKPRLYATYRCKWGFVAKGISKHMYCHLGMWIGIRPTCVTSVLQDKTEDENGFQNDQSSKAKTHADWLNFADYTCLGRPISVDAPVVKNAVHMVRYSVISGYPRLFLEYKCTEGFQIKDNVVRYRYCQDKKWVGNTPKCIKMQIRSDKELCDAAKCEQLCTVRDQMAHCHCKIGYYLTEDRLTCHDIDECAMQNGGCDHSCSNKHGSYLCSCKAGFLLDKDKHTCYSMMHGGFGMKPPMVLYEIERTRGHISKPTRGGDQ